MEIVLPVNRSWIYDSYFSLYRPIHPGGNVRGNCPDTPCESRVRGGRPSFRQYMPTSLNKEEEGRMAKDTNAGDGVSIKTPRGRQGRK